MPWKPHVTVAAVLLDAERRCLLVEEQPQERLVLNQPAGHLEAGESLPAACVREVHEETGLRFRPRWLTGIYRWQPDSSGRVYLRFCFGGDWDDADGHARPTDPDILGTLWLDRDTLARRRPQWRSPMVMRCLDDALAGRRYPLDLLQEFDPASGAPA